MKKGIWIIVIILLMSFIPAVKADSIMRINTQYEAIVTNPEGVTANPRWDSEREPIVLPFNEIIEIKLEVYPIAYFYYEGEIYEISMDDIAPREESISIENAIKLETPRKAFTLEENVLYQGPSTKFQIIESIPADYDFTFEYVILQLGEQREDELKAGYSLDFSTMPASWAYIEYNGKKGWIPFYWVKEKRTTAEHRLVIEEARELNKKVMKEFDLDGIHYSEGDFIRINFFYKGRNWIIKDDKRMELPEGVFLPPIPETPSPKPEDIKKEDPPIVYDEEIEEKFSFSDLFYYLRIIIWDDDSYYISHERSLFKGVMIGTIVFTILLSSFGILRLIKIDKKNHLTEE